MHDSSEGLWRHRPSSQEEWCSGDAVGASEPASAVLWNPSLPKRDLVGLRWRGPGEVPAWGLVVPACHGQASLCPCYPSGRAEGQIPSASAV